MTFEEIKELKKQTEKKYIVVKEEEFVNIEIIDLNFYVYFYDCTFNNCVFENINVDNVIIDNCKFTNCGFRSLKAKDMYIEICNSIFNECVFKEIEWESYEQTPIKYNKFEKCVFETIRLFLHAIEMNGCISESMIKKIFIVSQEMGFMEWKNCEIEDSRIMGYIVDNKFENINMHNTVIEGDVENNVCLNCMLDGKKFVLENNMLE